MDFSIRFFETADQLPLKKWDALLGRENILLSSSYFRAMTESSPDNMRCFAVGFFEKDRLIGGAFFQELRFSNGHSFGNAFEKISRIKRRFIISLGKRILIVGNNMISGQNAFFFSQEISTQQQLELLSESIRSYEKIYKRPCLKIFKDFEGQAYAEMRSVPSFLKRFASFQVQPSMFLNIRPEWSSYENYLSSFSTKYRTRANTARKKMEGLVCRELQLEDCEVYNKEILELYMSVSEKADFNFFTLPANHFFVLKNRLKEQFRIFAYFQGSKMVGVYTMLCNHKVIDTYFLGYNPHLQKQHQLYLNMLLDMAKWGIENKFEQINYGRTALEIKSTIGAEPVEMKGFMRHFIGIVQMGIHYYFSSLFKEQQWIQRNPFKEGMER